MNQCWPFWCILSPMGLCILPACPCREQNQMVQNRTHIIFSNHSEERTAYMSCMIHCLGDWGTWNWNCDTNTHWVLFIHKKMKLFWLDMWINISKISPHHWQNKGKLIALWWRKLKMVLWPDKPLKLQTIILVCICKFTLQIVKQGPTWPNLLISLCRAKNDKNCTWI